MSQKCVPVIFGTRFGRIFLFFCFIGNVWELLYRYLMTKDQKRKENRYFQKTVAFWGPFRLRGAFFSWKTLESIKLWFLILFTTTYPSLFSFTCIVWNFFPSNTRCFRNILFKFFYRSSKKMPRDRCMKKRRRNLVFSHCTPYQNLKTEL